MLNIHFIGFTKEEYEVLKPQIDQAIRETGLHGDAVTTFHANSVFESCDGKRKSMSYLYIFSSEEGHIPVIIESFVINDLFFDIESGTGDFIEAKEMEERKKKKPKPETQFEKECAEGLHK